MIVLFFNAMYRNFINTAKRTQEKLRSYYPVPARIQTEYHENKS